LHHFASKFSKFSGGHESPLPGCMPMAHTMRAFGTHIRVSPSFIIAPRLDTVEMIILMGNTEMWNKCPRDNDPPKQQNTKSHIIISTVSSLGAIMNEGDTLMCFSLQLLNLLIDLEWSCGSSQRNLSSLC
jgi:hypothetical protein